ncbi:triose-phosphate isomerase [Natronospirillum sp.]|uniref:triose-phosphate isomerase n=1 Tax=Natronospirillum sp. TaxID=2812955 RepID=UPI0025FB15E1|nr:triose-phosphate isomerase [Natronospirillum sp.]
MNKTLPEALSFAEQLRDAKIDESIVPFVIPPFTSARQVKTTLKSTQVQVGAQNMHWAESGAWTGEISPNMLTDCQLDLVELGHSERRTHFGETDESVGKKTEAAVRHGLIPLICVGETEQEKDAGQADQVLEQQVRGALSLLNAAQLRSPILLAYEPVWAIGENGKPATPQYANAKHEFINAVAQDIAGTPIPCLYGGSVNPDNATDLIRETHIDGLFIGRSAWEASGYIGILQQCAEELSLQ